MRTPLILWHHTIEPPKLAPAPLTTTDVYLAFRRAFLADSDLRICTREHQESVVVVLVREHERQIAAASVSVPRLLLETGSHVRLEREARWSARRFYGALTCARKRQYTSREEADTAIVDLLRLKLRGERPAWRSNAEQRAYKCTYCDGWHLTSKPLRARRHGSNDMARAAA